ncbi:hypothetical protein ACN24M_05635 [Streptomyces microflavus]
MAADTGGTGAPDGPFRKEHTPSAAGPSEEAAHGYATPEGTAYEYGAPEACPEDAPPPQPAPRPPPGSVNWTWR